MWFSSASSPEIVKLIYVTYSIINQQYVHKTVCISDVKLHSFSQLWIWYLLTSSLIVVSSGSFSHMSLDEKRENGNHG